MKNSYLGLGYPIISDQITAKELTVLLSELSAVISRGVIGDVVELGCYEGTAALHEMRLIRQLASDKQLWLYDSFEGLPEKSLADFSPAGTQFTTGALRTSKQKLIHNFKKAGLPLPKVKKAWFKDLKTDDLPDKICFAFLDGDYYDSIIQSLRLVWPKLSPGATVIVDDYQNEALPGAARAVNTWLSTHAVSISVEASLAIIRV
ncbi:MAG: TylF/MycF family methyltransferase [Candidatus Saccharibacteria bacterium]|nr:TylF/MycF family methyltransferase [Candidatus Saccharibacteria bacterium]